MNFRELIHKYKNGTATEEEIKMIEQEIEKYEAIEEYLADNMDIDFNEFDDEVLNVETSGIKKSVNSRLRKVVITSVSIVLAIVFSVFFIISPLVDRLYYDPTRISMGKEGKDLDFDLRAFTELNLPGYVIKSFAGAEKLGFGKYNIYFHRKNMFTEEVDNISMKIERNRRIATSFEDLFGENIYFGFKTIKEPDYTNDLQIFKEQKERVMNHINELNPVSYVSAYITFEEDLTMEELYKLQMEYRDVEFAWVGVRTSPEGERAEYITGFYTDPNAGPHSSTFPDEEKYPGFQILDYLSSVPMTDPYSVMPKAYEVHYTTLLKYMADRTDAVEVFDFSPLKTQYYHSALDYIEEHGIKTFGALIYANAEDLIEFVENTPIKNIEIDQVLASKRFIW